MRIRESRLQLLATALVLSLGMVTGIAATEGESRFGHQAVPNVQLDKEHDLTVRLAAVAEETAKQLRSDTSVPRERVADLHDFFVNFVDACHHAKEEQFYFPVALSADPGLQSVVRTLELQHDIGASLLAGVERALQLWQEDEAWARREAADNLEAYARLIRRHIELESARMMKPADRALSDQQKAVIRSGFHFVEAEQLGEGFHARYHTLAMEMLGEDGH